MTNADFSHEFSTILNLLRDHSNLMYSQHGMEEYHDKELSAIGYFINLLYKKTGFAPPIPELEFMPISQITDPSYASAKRFVKRIETRLKAKARESSGNIKKKYEEYSLAWERVFEAL